MTVAMPLPTKITIEQPLKVTHRGLRAQFGDGRAQRAGLGTNRKVRSYSITWAPLTSTERDTVISALDSVETFGTLTYTACGETTEYNYELVEGAYAVKPLNANGLYEISCEIRQVY